MKKDEDKEISLPVLLLIIAAVIIAGLLSDPLPPNCHTTPSVDAGGGEIECD